MTSYTARPKTPLHFTKYTCSKKRTGYVSKVLFFSFRYSRPDVLALGKYALNLIGCSKHVAEEIYKVVEYLSPKVCDAISLDVEKC